MANWVEGKFVLYGSKEEISEFKKYITEKEEWKNVINRNAPDDLEDNEIYIYDNNYGHALMIAAEMEEKFRNSCFHFFICDEMNGIGWGINYMNNIETDILYDEKHDDEGNYWLEPSKLDVVYAADEYFDGLRNNDDSENGEDIFLV